MRLADTHYLLDMGIHYDFSPREWLKSDHCHNLVERVVKNKVEEPVTCFDCKEKIRSTYAKHHRMYIRHMKKLSLICVICKEPFTSYKKESLYCKNHKKNPWSGAYYENGELHFT